jgi:segregation and condensation protein B
MDAVIRQLERKYSGDCGIRLLRFNHKLQFATNPEYKEPASRVLQPIREKEFTRSILECAAIIAYKQPVTRIDLEEIRGNSEYAVQKLLELGVIEPVGRKDAVGKPVLFGTTDKFLKRFQISSLDELPDYEDLINKIQLIHGDKQEDDYLYSKDVYVEETATTDLSNENKKIDEKTTDEGEDFDLPDISEEEIPDFLKGEDVEKI